MTLPPMRSLLFTPATRPAAFARGLESGADILCVDLEDAVPPAQKDAARPDALAFLAGEADGAGPLRALRINPPDTRAGLDDLRALLDAAPARGLVLLPKADAPDVLGLIDRLLAGAGSGLRLAALIESMAGVARAAEIARATPRLAMLLFGAVDYSADLGAENAEAPMAHARARVVLAGRGAGLDVMDTPELAFRDLDGVAAAARRARAHGFTGKAVIHPSNIAPVHVAFTPSAEEIAEARALIAAWHAAPDGLAVVDGRLIEQPVIRAMQRRLALAAAAGVA